MSTAIERYEDHGEIEVASSSLVPAGIPAIIRAEIDSQIATARSFPRSVSKSLNAAQELATYNADVAAKCLYALPRDGKTIEGPSARLAEILAASWGHLRTQGRIIEETDRFIVARGECIDLQANNARSMEVRRRITDRKGRRYSDDMIATTANAAISIACRNAVLAVVPRALWEPIYQAARKCAAGSIESLEAKRKFWLDHWASHGVEAKEVFAALGVVGRSDLGLEQLATMQGWENAIEDQAATVEGIFRPAVPTPGETATKKLAETIKSRNTKHEPKTATPLLDQAKPADTDVWPEGRE